MKYQYIFWDLDGTLTDPGLGITNSILYSLEKFGIVEKDRTKLYPFIGPPLLESYEKFYGFKEDECEKAVLYYREYFGDKGKFENEVYEGIPEFLQKLVDKGYKLVLATSKPEHFAREIMEHFDLAKYFYRLCGSSVQETHETKADVIRKAIWECSIEDVSRVLMIGDRMHDVCGASECGMDSVGVLWGYGSREELLQNGATYLVSNLKELEKVILA